MEFLVFYSLDPDGDPLCALLMIDYYAIRSEQYDFLVRLFNEWEVRFMLVFLPLVFKQTNLSKQDRPRVDAARYYLH